MRQAHRMVWPCLIMGILGSGLGCTVAPTNDTASAPTITSFIPAQTLVGNQVTISGTSFSGATALTFNGVPVTVYSLDSATQITATVPPAASTGKLTVTNSAGTATSSATFSVIPAITAISPTMGPTGTTVTLTGSGFLGTTRVTFGAQSSSAYGAAFTVDGANQVTATVPADAITGAVYLSSSDITCTGPVFTVQ